MRRKTVSAIILLLVLTMAVSCESKTFQETINGEWNESILDMNLGSSATFSLENGSGTVVFFRKGKPDGEAYDVRVISEAEKEMVLLITEQDASPEAEGIEDQLKLKYISKNHFQVLLGDGQGLIVDYKRK